jgi:hypothetical protein
LGIGASDVSPKRRMRFAAMARTELAQAFLVESYAVFFFFCRIENYSNVIPEPWLGVEYY